MNQQLKHQIKSYFKYRKQAVGRHSVHSPFVYQFIDEVLRKVNTLSIQPEAEEIRRKLKSNSGEVENIDFGAGSTKSNDQKKTVAEIAKTALLPKKYARLLDAICSYYEYKSVLELGTSLGVTTLYLANKNRKVVTLEGNPHVAKLAEAHLSEMTDVTQVIGEFDKMLPTIMENRTFDFILIDGNHTEEATLRYFEMLYPFLSNKGMLVFDDIYWSEGMTRAWKKIKEDTRHNLSMDVFKFGIVVKGMDMEKQDFVLKYA